MTPIQHLVLNAWLVLQNLNKHLLPNGQSLRDGRINQLLAILSPHGALFLSKRCAIDDVLIFVVRLAHFDPTTHLRVFFA